MLRNYTNRVIAAGMPKPAPALSVAELIEKLTPAALETALAVSVQGISNMKQRDAIPAKHWPAVVSLANKASDPVVSGLTYEDLVRMHTPAPPVVQRESGRRNHQGTKQRQAAGAR